MYLFTIHYVPELYMSPITLQVTTEIKRKYIIIVWFDLKRKSSAYSQFDTLEKFVFQKKVSIKNKINKRRQKKKTFDYNLKFVLCGMR